MQPLEKARPIGAAEDAARETRAGRLPLALAHLAVLLLRGFAIVLLAAPFVIALALLLG